MVRKDKIYFILEAGKPSLKTMYYSDEKSFGLIEPLQTISILLGHQYMSLELDFESQTVIGVSGFFDSSLCKRSRINKDATSLRYIVRAEFEEFISNISRF